MRKLVLFMVTTVDGFTGGPNGELDWPNVDKEFSEFSIEQLRSLGALMFGRVTYEGMQEYWTSAEAVQFDPEITRLMNAAEKYVFSRTLDKASWNNTTLLRGDPMEEVNKLKRQEGKDIAVFGSSNLAVSLMERGLIDEFRIMLHPIALGDGRSLFRGLTQRLPLKLTASRVFNSGNVMLHYEPRDKA